MAASKANPYVFVRGFVESREVIRVIAQLETLNKRGSSYSQMMKWIPAGHPGTDKKWGYFGLEWSATRLLRQGELFATGPAGIVLVATPTGHTVENVDPSLKGPSGMGDLTDLRWIGKHLYAVGMGRQVYRRDGLGKWVHRDAGTVEKGIPKGIRGFSAIDGLSENDMVAVGYAGEIWRCLKGKWKQLASPTNAVLECLRVVSPTLAYAAGADGVLLRGNGDAWTQIKHEETDQEFWGMEWFKDNLYLATENAIYRLNPDDTLKKIKLPRGWTTFDLHANDGILLSVGDKHVAWTEDTQKWNEITP